MKAKKFIDLSGRKFHRWTAESLNHITADYRAMWNCSCDCGIKRVIRASSLTTGNSKSCGCHRVDTARASQTKHGKYGAKIWNTWNQMIQRCSNENDCAYANYGGRGIAVCNRWLKFENFYADMGDPPSSAHSIDRINNGGDYELGNCRWATQKEQANNRRSNTWLTAFSKTQTIAQWSDELGIKRATICQRLARGASHEEALKSVR